jgi:hypothetical protein
VLSAWGRFLFLGTVPEEIMLGFKDVAAMGSAVALMMFQPTTTSGTNDAPDSRMTELAFNGTFKGVDEDGQALVWSSDAPATAPGFIIYVRPMGSAMSSAESVWPVSATLVTHDTAGAPMVAKLYGIINWPKKEIRLHGDCESGGATGSSVTALGELTDFDVAGTVNVLPLTASR